MKIAIFSDLHDNRFALDRLLADAERRGVDEMLYLGDVGHSLELFGRLRLAGIPCIFGNWEVSGLGRMQDDLRAWVAGWPSSVTRGDVVAVHASPDLPPSVVTTADAAAYMRRGVGWHTLFPRLDRDEDAVWRALAVMEEQGIRVAFHGHTHVQKVWSWADQGDAHRRLAAMSHLHELVLSPGPAHAPNRYIVGVGSVGQPHDGPLGRYAIYDSSNDLVLLCPLADLRDSG